MPVEEKEECISCVPIADIQQDMSLNGAIAVAKVKSSAGIVAKENGRLAGGLRGIGRAVIYPYAIIVAVVVIPFTIIRRASVNGCFKISFRIEIGDQPRTPGWRGIWSAKNVLFINDSCLIVIDINGTKLRRELNLQVQP